ncbi:MAG: methyltransferase domain-containing protein [Frankiales bacterium]|nr:methyltransferase domain-containing protein [Frankiales bacterium]
MTAAPVPVVDGIPYARVGREALAASVQARLDAGDVDGARVLLLGDGDDWWSSPPPPPEQLAQVVGAASLREAMALLGLGRVGDYFAHRWSDPTYLSGLALLQQHWPGDRPVVEIACGAGHFLRELVRRGVTDVVGVDVVWAKLWLAQRFVCPEARYVCADVTALPSLDVPTPAYVLMHDALYFVADKAAAARGMRALAGPGGTIVVGHAHVTDQHGLPLPAEGWAELLQADVLYDDDELTTALLAGRPPVSSRAQDLAGSEALAAVSGALLTPCPADLGEPLGPLRLNPLYVDGALTWPSDRYAQEYGPRSHYLPLRAEPLPSDAARRRVLLDLPERW